MLLSSEWEKNFAVELQGYLKVEAEKNRLGILKMADKETLVQGPPDLRIYMWAMNYEGAKDKYNSSGSMMQNRKTGESQSALVTRIKKNFIYIFACLITLSLPNI